MSKKSLFLQNKKQILFYMKNLGYLSEKELKKVLAHLKKDFLLPISLSYNNFLLSLIDEGLVQFNVSIRGHLKVRYTFDKELKIYDFCNSLEKDSYFSMTTSLNLQDLCDFRQKYIFVSKERKARLKQKNLTLSQKDIDLAFKKEPRRTKAYDKIKDFTVILLESNNTSSYGIEDFNGYKISSQNRAFVEIISNVHYFQSTKNVIDIFSKIKNKLNLDEIYQIIEKFDFVYSYFQIGGFYLEKIGFKKEELLKFHKRKTNLRYYTQKNQSNYNFDNYWGVYF